MKFVIQRVKTANVKVDGEVLGAIEKGFMVLIGVAGDDTKEIADKMVDKMRASNSKRLSKMKCEAVQGLYFNEILVDLERVADHSLNIAQAAKKYEIYDEDEDL